MTLNEQKAALEALLYVSGEEGLAAGQIADVLNIPEASVGKVIDAIQEDLKEDKRGLTLAEIAGRYQLITKPQMAGYLQKLVDTPKTTTLSQAALETLAVIAYNKPVSRAEIEDVRGVKSEKALQNLMAKGLIKEAGRAEGTGRAILYDVTEAFLDHFGLRSLDELPPLPEVDHPDESEADLFYEKFQQTVLDV
ncbi:SMC-Scp complex subunit ScpB [Camelliibacillus cellulosilyticus]|uniref:Segregation and condensation protein B n=1 Tax=Camelliibacillus cellulosilyticus TaxID=2174486 RepID=A0ABV9GME3_9BACL